MYSRKLQKLNVPKRSLFFNAGEKDFRLYGFDGPKTCFILQFRYSTMFSIFNIVHIVLFYILKHAHAEKIVFFKPVTLMAAFNLASNMAAKLSFQFS